MKNKTGITLIALIITIVVLLILAGVSLNAILGNNGVITQAQKSHEETRGASVDELVNSWKNDLRIHKVAGTMEDTKSVLEVVEELVEQNLINEYEKELILGNEEKGIEAEYAITIGDRRIEFYTDEYRDGTPGLYATKMNILIKTWQELLDEDYITVSDNKIVSWNKEKKGDLIIDDSILEIDEYAFYNKAQKLTLVEIPETLKKIGIGAFKGCTGLTEFTIKKGVEEIEKLAFNQCTGLRKIRVENSNFVLVHRK